MIIEVVEQTPEDRAFEILAKEFDSHMGEMPTDAFDFEAFDNWRKNRSYRVIAFMGWLSGDLPRSILVPLAGI